MNTPFVRARAIRLASLLTLLPAGAALFAQYNDKNLAPVLDAPAGKDFNAGRLRLYPIVANEAFRLAHEDIGNVVPMNKALSDGRLKIQEHEQGPTVNTLQAVNTSKDTIYLMQGEVVVGGKQDRILAQDVLVAPGATIDIAAFCVEHGRWTEQRSGEQFIGTAGVAAQDVRKAAAVDQEQSKVWEKVAENVAAQGAATSTGSYAHLMNDREVQAERARYREKLIGLASSRAGIVGVIAVSGDRVIGCDVMATEEMFRQAYPQLLDAYIVAALSHGAPVTVSDDEVGRQFKDLFHDEAALEKKLEGNGSVFKAKGRTYRVSKF